MKIADYWTIDNGFVFWWDMDLTGQAATSALNDFESAAANITLYPNPADNLLTINSNISINKLEVYNMIGQVVYAEKSGAKITTINVADLKAGYYVVKIITDNGIATKNVVIK